MAACSRSEGPPKVPASHEMTLASPVFTDGEAIPKDYGCSGSNQTPPLVIGNVPANAKSLALMVDDPDAPGGHFTHYIVWNIPPDSRTVKGTEGTNSYGKPGWGPPCPPSGEHRYVFSLYALDTMIDVPPDKGREDVDKAMAGHVVAQAEITGRYKR